MILAHAARPMPRDPKDGSATRGFDGVAFPKLVRIDFPHFATRMHCHMNVIVDVLPVNTDPKSPACQPGSSHQSPPSSGGASGRTQISHTMHSSGYMPGTRGIVAGAVFVLFLSICCCCHTACSTESPEPCIRSRKTIVAH